ncbi:hypothetical protein [Paenibacillus endoradicis]|uniref:hypothetical protein n=1 Tax=Paenibacillus endoradicis TaxID=2972487 RepID=UPI00215982AD|nr:hypothetical protein [Paenibacillus endoradicis]MCR8656648.1 hypothetical protein [Paenibacillus endoradicis]
MPIRTRRLLLCTVILAAVIITISQLPSYKENPLQDTPVNKNIISTNSFVVNSDSTELNTSAKGTVFVSGEEDKVEQIRIVAIIEIDPEDWGGVAVNIPQKWKIANIISSYPENETQLEREQFISTWTTTDKEKQQWGSIIEVGRERSYKPNAGGKGTIVIDIVPDGDSDQTGIINFVVEVGSSYKGTYKIMGTHFIEIPILLSSNGG